MNRQLQSLHVNEVREKIGSKKELYDFLVQECGAYLPKINCSNIYFFKSIMIGEKEVSFMKNKSILYLKRHEITVAAVPQIEGLTADDFLDYAKGKPSLLKYLPDQCDWLHLDKKWICDILLTLDSDGVNQMILHAKTKRREKLDKSQNLIVHMRPEFVQALNTSINYSVQKGRSAHLIKQSSQRKRRTHEVEEVKEEEKALKGSKQRYLQDNKRMKDEFDQMRGQINDLLGYQQLVHQLHEDGIIDENGTAQSRPQQERMQ